MRYGKLALPAIGAALIAASILATACDEGQTIIQTGDATDVGVSVQGRGSAFGGPDVAVLQIGVQVTQPTVEAARNQAATSLKAVVDSLKVNGVADKDIQTVDFSVQPQYDFSGRVQVLRGYQVSNVVTARVRKLDTAGKAIDDATRAGGNDAVVRGISFTIDDPTELRSQARERAVADARRRAEELAKSTGVSLGKPISIVETISQGVPQPVIAARTGAADTVETPVQAGQLEVVVFVTIVYSME
jgi:hypothetical protein